MVMAGVVGHHPMTTDGAEAQFEPGEISAQPVSIIAASLFELRGGKERTDGGADYRGLPAGRARSKRLSCWKSRKGMRRSKIENTIRYLRVDVDDALSLVRPLKSDPRQLRDDQEGAFVEAPHFGHTGSPRGLPPTEEGISAVAQFKRTRYRPIHFD